MCGLSGRGSLADGIHLPLVHRPKVLADREAVVSLCHVWASGFGNGGNGLSRHTETTADVVSGDVVGYQSKERGQRQRVAADVGTGKLSHRVELAA